MPRPSTTDVDRSLLAQRRGFLASALLCGAILVFLTPPYQIPDEPMHFRRILALTRGDLVGTVQQGQVGSALPANLREFEETHLRQMIGNPDQTFSRDRLRATTGMVPSDSELFLPYPTAALYSPVPYIIPAMGAFAAEGAGGGFLSSFYAARFANLAAGCLLVWIALTIAPGITQVILPLALLPMILFLRSSVSADVLTFSLSWLLLSVVVHERCADQERPVVKMVVAVLLVLTKPLFIIVALLGLFGPVQKRQWRSVLVYCAGILLAALLAAHITSSVLVPIRPDAVTDPAGQMQRSLREPVRVGFVLVRDLVTRAPRYGVEAIGRLGWLDTPMPMAITVCFAAALLLLAMTAEAPSWLTPPVRLFFSGVALLGVFAVLWSSFVLWTPPSSAGVEGTQGRYFLPLAPLLLVSLMGLLDRRFEKLRDVTTWSLIVAAPLVTIAVILERYWI